MTDFKAKKHQIRFRLGLCPRPRCAWELTALPRRPSWIWGSLRGRGRGWAGEQEGKGREGKWRGGIGRAPKLLLNRAPQSLATPLQSNADCAYWSNESRKVRLRRQSRSQQSTTGGKEVYSNRHARRLVAVEKLTQRGNYQENNELDSGLSVELSHMTH